MNSAPSSIPVPNGQVRIAAIYNGNAMFGVHLKRDVPWVPLVVAPKSPNKSHGAF